MFKIPKTDPRDAEFIKKANSDPNWPEDLDKPVDWDAIRAMPQPKQFFHLLGMKMPYIITNVKNTLILIAGLGLVMWFISDAPPDDPDEDRRLRQELIEEEIEEMVSEGEEYYEDE